MSKKIKITNSNYERTLSKERLLLSTALIWNDFISISNQEKLHDDDVRDFRFHIHAIQNIIKAQLGDDYLRELRLRAIDDAGKILKEIQNE